MRAFKAITIAALTFAISMHAVTGAVTIAAPNAFETEKKIAAFSRLQFNKCVCESVRRFSFDAVNLTVRPRATRPFWRREQHRLVTLFHKRLGEAF